MLKTPPGCGRLWLEPDVENATKRCTSCRLIKSIEDFAPRGGSRRDRLAWCRTCASGRTSAWARARVRERRGLPADAPKMQGRGTDKPEGSTFTHKGYVIVKATGHHRADPHGWVYQHILAAEAKYGIPIPRGFTVHHRNGVRSDNRPENLELRVGPHGKGADVLPGLLRNPQMRVEARRILAQYDDGPG